MSEDSDRKAKVRQAREENRTVNEVIDRLYLAGRQLKLLGIDAFDDYIDALGRPSDEPSQFGSAIARLKAAYREYLGVRGDVGPPPGPPRVVKG